MSRTNEMDKMIGEIMWIFPNDSTKRIAKLIAVDEYGFHFDIVAPIRPANGRCRVSHPYKRGQRIFVAHAVGLTYIHLSDYPSNVHKSSKGVTWTDNS